MRGLDFAFRAVFTRKARASTPAIPPLRLFQQLLHSAQRAYGVVSRRTGVRAEAAVPSPARNTLRRPNPTYGLNAIECFLLPGGRFGPPARSQTYGSHLWRPRPTRPDVSSDRGQCARGGCGGTLRFASRPYAARNSCGIALSTGCNRPPVARPRSKALS
jgi:hypothetical protein